MILVTPIKECSQLVKQSTVSVITSWLWFLWCAFISIFRNGFKDFRIFLQQKILIAQEILKAVDGILLIRSTSSSKSLLLRLDSLTYHSYRCNARTRTRIFFSRTAEYFVSFRYLSNKSKKEDFTYLSGLSCLSRMPSINTFDSSTKLTFSVNDKTSSNHSLVMVSCSVAYNSNIRSILVFRTAILILASPFFTFSSTSLH